MDATNSESTALHDYVSALLECTGALMLVVNHMAEAAVTAPPDADDVPTVLARLIEGALAPADLRVAAMVVERTRERIGEELYLVPHAVED
jgi:hypothetical protein